MKRLIYQTLTVFTLLLLFSCSQPVTEVGSGPNEELRQYLQDNPEIPPFPPTTTDGGINWGGSTTTMQLAPGSIRRFVRPTKVDVIQSHKVDYWRHRGNRWQGGTFDGKPIRRWHYGPFGWRTEWVQDGRWSWQGYWRTYNWVDIKVDERWNVWDGYNHDHDMGYIAPVVVKYNSQYYMFYTRHWRVYDEANEYTHYTDYYMNYYRYSDNGNVWLEGSVNDIVPGQKTMTFKTTGYPEVERGISFSSALVKDGYLKMWYNGKDKTDSTHKYWRLYYSHTSSNDATLWTTENEYSGGGLLKSLDVSVKGFDSSMIGKSNVLYSDAQYKMWYTGYDSRSERYNIGYATARSGVNDWSKNVAPIFKGTSGKFDTQGVADPFVIKDGSIYKMWYAGYDGTKWQLGLAYSWDGTTFVYHNQDNYTPLNIQDETFDVRYPSVIKESGMYRIWYSYRLAGDENDPWKIGYTESPITP